MCSGAGCRPRERPLRPIARSPVARPGPFPDRACRWSADGTKICIAYGDAAVIVGSVDGKRLWGKDLDIQNLSHVEWSPDGRLLVFCSDTECFLFDSSGNAIQELPLSVAMGRASAKIVALEWYAGLKGYPEEGCPCLAVGVSSGQVQLMTSHRDASPIEVDTGLHLKLLRWSPDGSTFLAAGTTKTAGGGGDSLVVEVFTYEGVHVRSLKVPGTTLSSVTWEGSGLRLAIAVDSFIYFANVRPGYGWGLLSDSTVVFPLRSARNPQAQVVFWDSTSGESVAKPVPRLTGLRACGSSAVAVQRGALTGSTATLYDGIGTPVAECVLSVELSYTAMTPTHFVGASDDSVFVWRLPVAAADATRGRRSEWIFSIDGGSTTDQWALDRFEPAGTADPITALCLSPTTVFVARASGTVHLYSLSDMRQMGRVAVGFPATALASNCDGSRISAANEQGTMSMFEIVGVGTVPRAEALGVERRDVWDMRWASDDPTSLALLEKSRMVVVRGTQVDDPLPCSSYLGGFEGMTGE